MKHIIPILVILLLLSSGFVGVSYSIDDIEQSTMPILYDGNILYVGGNGSGNYTKIQDAIDNASDGDTVFVFDESSPYHEHILINKEINVIGENRNTTVIDGDFDGIPVKIDANNCLVSGFTIKNCAKEQTLEVESAVILINKCENVVICDNILILDDYFSGNAVIECIYLNDSYFCTIQDNIIFDSKLRGYTRGIALGVGSSYNIITGNNISGYCIGVDFKFGCVNNNISENYIHDNLHGIDIWGCNYNLIINNILEKNGYRGIRLACGSQYNRIIGNIIRCNGRGVQHDGGIKLMDEDCRDNIISGNVFSNNSKYGIVIINTSYNVFENNYFINNDKNVYFVYPFILINRNRWRSNYWDKPRVLPYIIYGTGYILGLFPVIWFNIDWHPAQEPYDIGV